MAESRAIETTTARDAVQLHLKASCGLQLLHGKSLSMSHLINLAKCRSFPKQGSGTGQTEAS